MYCPKCGAEVENTTVFCPSCGENLNPTTCMSNTKPLRPDTYLVWSILCTLFCCMPFGIVSIVYAASVNSKYDAGQYDDAKKASLSAKNWAIWGALSVIISMVLYFILVAVFGVALLSLEDFANY